MAFPGDAGVVEHGRWDRLEVDVGDEEYRCLPLSGCCAVSSETSVESVQLSYHFQMDYSTPTITYRARIKVVVPVQRRRSIRRMSSPTECSLRELSEKDAWQTTLRQKQSEEELQRVYETQILAYLNADYADLEEAVQAESEDEAEESCCFKTSLSPSSRSAIGITLKHLWRVSTSLDIDVLQYKMKMAISESLF
ncbi:hypothetical protein M409DRAFT_56912 [Zasmidium cellare ATCC 36951]|uniref:Uncharacterized protein n=1 Tax=Zasmidium cellare ATCC 36951 TaxID=1080233 RepID=A0A6A6CE71_ZASCE|nr:uncharacterized protein M409DRAFT_56912 [Zasmidium cellare ATCC 36951]KAF2164222.1 hypothetical protein M409DRAFT_56912 [Zasmidium cellare ATCC 36951]